MTGLRRLINFACAALAAFGLASCDARSDGGAAQPTSPAAKVDPEFGNQVRAYLLQHPEVIEEAVQVLQERRLAQADAALTKSLAANRRTVENDPRDYVANPNGKITVVEFFDYNCGYCKISTPEVLALIRQNPDVRFVFKDLVIFGGGSEYAAAAADLAKPAGKYLAVHRDLMAAKPLNEAAVNRILTSHGLDPAAARARLAAARPYFRDVQALAKKLNIEGTPAFIIGDTMVPGADMAAVREAIAGARKDSA